MKADSERIIGLYERHAHTYARDRGTRLLDEKDWLDRFLALLPPQASILDVGCGTADPMDRYFIENGNNVTGIDSSPSLIQMCSGEFPKQNWTVADMRSLSLDRCFNGILALDSLFHLSPNDQRRMFPILKKHAAPSAALMFTSGPSYGEAIGSYCGEPLYHASLDPEEYRSLLKENGFDVISHVVEAPACYGHTIWLAQLR
jgi:SAM-dependent methyltransferase